MSAVPNPSDTRFTLRIRSGTDKPVEIRVLNLLGSLVEQRLNVASNITLQIGKRYKAGMYFVEVRQGEESALIELVKE